MKIEETLDTQKVWGWEIAAYLFLAGVGAGAYLTGFVANLIHSELVIVSRVGVLLGAPLVIIGILFLIMDLGKKTLAFLTFSQPGSSWIARGTIIITVFVILDLSHIGMWIWPFTLLESVPGLHLALGSITAVFALLTLIYTGIVLGVAKPIAFWDLRVLPWLFLISSISIGIMGVAFSLSVYGLSAGQVVEQPQMLLVHYNAFIIIVEVLIIVFYLWRMHQVREARISVHIVTKGMLAGHFWGGVVVAGLMVPFAFAIYGAYMPTIKPILILTALFSIIGLVGGFMLRYVVIAGGTRTPLNVEGVLIPLPETLKAKLPRRTAF